MDDSTDFQILTSSRSWMATPWDYSSLRGLRFFADSTGDFIFGCGQTIYALIKFRFELSEDIIRVNYSESPAQRHRQACIPDDAHRVKEIKYELSQEVLTGVESVVAQEFKFNWKLSLDRSPFPDDLSLPDDVPLINYGHEEKIPRRNDGGDK